jgi:hypothetical protein
MSYSIRQNPASTSNYTLGRSGNTAQEVVIHHGATTNFDGIGATFANPNRGTSAHYGVGQNNNVDQYVSESDTAWHAGSWEHNLRSIGIENVNLTMGPEWAIADSTFATLVDLVRDIATRNGLLPLEVGRNLFGHQDVIDKSVYPGGTSCPGRLEARLQELANAVNNGTTPTPVPSEADQVLHIGEKFVFPKSYRVDALAFINGIWQIQTNELCPTGFNWDDNGIPTDPVTEVAGGVGNPSDQVLQVGSLYTIPGEYTVLNLGFNSGMWLAQIDMGGYRLWVDIATVTEV